MKGIISKLSGMDIVETATYHFSDNAAGINSLGTKTTKAQREETTTNTSIPNKQKWLAIISGVLSGSLSAGSLGAMLSGLSGMVIGGAVGAILGGMFILLLVINADQDNTGY